MTHWGNSFPGNETFPSTPAAEGGEAKDAVEYVTVNIRYGIGYGTHETDMEVPSDATEEQIHELVWEMLAERLDFGWERVE